MEQKTPLYKALDMEEFLDIWFYHPLGFRIALLGKRLALSADQVTYASMFLGIAGGLMLSRASVIWWGYALLIISSVLDSADGQLARMTGKSSERGRILDGMIGYFTFTCAYLGLCLLYLSNPEHAHGAVFIFSLAIISGMFTAVQSSLYDFYRTSFSSIVTKAKVEMHNESEKLSWFFKFCYSGYHVYQKMFASSHLAAMAAMVSKTGPDGRVPDSVRALYRKTNKPMVRMWNLLGDNTRFLAIAAVLILYRPELYFFFIIIVVSLLAAVLIMVQRYKDYKFITELRGL